MQAPSQGGSTAPSGGRHLTVVPDPAAVDGANAAAAQVPPPEKELSAREEALAAFAALQEATFTEMLRRISTSQNLHGELATIVAHAREMLGLEEFLVVRNLEIADKEPAADKEDDKDPISFTEIAHLVGDVLDTTPDVALRPKFVELAFQLRRIDGDKKAYWPAVDSRVHCAA